jgi:hypothetical protein
VGKGAVLDQEYVQRGVIACNVLFGNASLGTGMVVDATNLALDPLLVAPGSGDFRLAEGSPAGNAGCAAQNVAPTLAAGAFGGPLGNWPE